MSPGLIQTILLALTGVALLVLLGIIVYQRVAIRSAQRGREAIDREEHRVFDFLHGLGESLIDHASPRQIYKAIGTGVKGVVESGGSALYIWDSASNELVPKYLSPGCPPLVPVPEHVVNKAKKNKKAISSYTRLVPVPRGSGTVGKVFACGNARNIGDLNSEPDLDSEFQKSIPVLLAPLTYGETGLGVLAVTGNKGDRPFDAHTFELFRSVAEQSAFALGNALAHRDAAEKHRIDKEIRAASEIQQILLPSEAPEVPGFSLAGENVPASIVSGDYYDFIEIDEDHLSIAIADVSGKGIPASLITAMCRAVLRLNAHENRSPREVVSAVNRQLFPDMREDMFISMAYLVLDRRTGDVTLARAGHDPPYHYSAATKTLRQVRPGGLAVGIDAGPVFDRVTQEETFRLEEGDALFLFTDGVNEALNKNGEEFGLPALENAIVATAGTGAEGMISAVLSSVREHVGDHPQSDDITLIALENGNIPAQSPAETNARAHPLAFFVPGRPTDFKKNKHKYPTMSEQDPVPEEEILEETAPVEGEPAPAEEPVAELTPLEAAQEEANKWRDHAMRATADLENYRKRMVKEKSDAVKFANADLLRGLLPVLDNFTWGLDAARAESESSPIFQGMQMVHKQIEDFLAAEGVETLVTEGADFDPNIHDAVSQEASETEPEGTILAQTRRGYRLKDRLLRPAAVVVSAGVTKEEPVSEA